MSDLSVESILFSRFEALERSKSVGNLSKSGRPTILKPLKLWRPGADGKKRMLWVYGNPWEGGPRYLRTHRLEKQINGMGEQTLITDLSVVICRGSLTSQKQKTCPQDLRRRRKDEIGRSMCQAPLQGSPFHLPLPPRGRPCRRGHHG